MEARVEVLDAGDVHLQDLPDVLSNTDSLFGFAEGQNVEAGGVGSDGYSSDEETEKDPQDTVLFPRPSSPPMSGTHSQSAPTPKTQPGTTPAKSKKSPDAKRSRIAREREQKKREKKVAEASKADRQAKAKKIATSADNIGTLQSSIKLVLKKAKDLNVTMGDVVCYFFNPENSCDRYGEFWKNAKYFEDLMASISTRKNATPTGRERIHRWAIDHVKRSVRSEAQAITSSRCLQSRHIPINEDFVLGFRLQHLEDRLAEFCPVMLEVAVWFGTSTAQERAMKKSGEELTTKLHKRKVAVTALLSLLREYNQYNNRFQQILAVFMYASGLQRQCFSILSRLGILVTYTSLVRTTPRPRRQTLEAEGTGNDQATSEVPGQRLGLLVELSRALRAKARQLVSAVVVAIAYDNINFTSRVAEQSIGHTDMQENGTCATLYVVPGVLKEDLDVDAYHETLFSAPPLKLDDLALTPEEYDLEQESLVQTILGIILEHGNDFYSRYKELLDSELPKVPTSGAYTLYPLPAMNVDEGSVDGNLDVYETITKELSPTGTSISPGSVKMLMGDQLSMALTRKGISWRVGNEDAASSMGDIVLGPGLFHLLMTYVTLILENSWGLPNNEANPASLSAHNTLLGRRPITLTSPPKFRDALDLITVSLFARVFYTLPLSAGAKDMEDYANQLAALDGPKPNDFKKSYDRLKSDIKKQIRLYADIKVAVRLRKEREAQTKNANENSPDNPTMGSSMPPGPTPILPGDMVYESGVLFFNLALRLRNLVEAIRSGNSNRIVVILKTLVLAFRGTRHTKYAYETVVFLHNYLHVWPIALRNAVMKAWLVNISGRPGSYKPADLMQEHLNLQIKEIYKAHGSNQSWEWLAMISPCVHLLRRVAHEFHATLGDRQGTKHSAVSIDDDIRALVENLKEHHVYELRPGRKFDPHDSPPKDVITEGYRRLAHGPERTIDHYNRYFKDLQERFKVSPVSEMLPQPSSSPGPSPNSPPATVSNSVDDYQLDHTTDGPQENLNGGGGLEEIVPNDEDEDNGGMLFNWNEMGEDIGEVVTSEEEDFVDEESESDGEL